MYEGRFTTVKKEEVSHSGHGPTEINGILEIPLFHLSMTHTLHLTRNCKNWNNHVCYTTSLLSKTQLDKKYFLYEFDYVMRVPSEERHCIILIMAR